MPADSPLVGAEKSSLVEIGDSPPSEIFAVCDVLETGSGECLPKLPEGGLLSTATDRVSHLQCKHGSRPVENIFGTQVDTINKNAAQEKRASKRKNE